MGSLQHVDLSLIFAILPFVWFFVAFVAHFGRIGR